MRVRVQGLAVGGLLAVMAPTTAAPTMTTIFFIPSLAAPPVGHGPPFDPGALLPFPMDPAMKRQKMKSCMLQLGISTVTICTSAAT